MYSITLHLKLRLKVLSVGDGMSYFQVQFLQKKHKTCYDVPRFLLDMIQEEFGYGYVPDYHQDIVNMEEYYLNPERNEFLIAIDHETKKLIGTIGIRAYDKDFRIFKDVYHADTTASIWRVFVSKPWRRNGVASTLLSLAENFCRKSAYDNIYLHTHKNLPGSLDFWLRKGYEITWASENKLETVHMEKKLF